MNILCIGYYDKFSRFFLSIKKELKKENSNLKFKIISLFFSGYLYSKTRNTSSILFSFKAWINVLIHFKKYSRIIESNNSYKNIELVEVIKYHKRLNKDISKKHLLLQAVSYIDLILKEFLNFKPHVILLVGDSRLVVEITKNLAKIHNIKVYYIELGPFNTTFFNDIGVNANAIVSSSHKKFTNPIKNTKIDTFINNSSKEYNRSYLYRGIDYIFNTFFEKSIVYPPDLKYTDTFLPILKTQKKELPLKIDKEAVVFLLILQIPLDVNMIHHSPYFNNHYSIVKAIHENSPNNTQLVIREHPIYKGKYEKKLYDYAKKHNLTFDYNTSLEDSLKYTQTVIVNNSTVGIEAIALKKTVVVLGNAYYDNPKICIKYNGKVELKKVLENALNFSPSNENIKSFLYNLFESNLVKGNIKDKNLIAARTISKIILHNYNNS